MSTGEDRGGTAGPDDIGSVAEETAKLFHALQDWARESGVSEAGRAAQDLGEHLSGVGDHIAHGEDCRYCPVCQAIRLVRATSPEVRAHLAAAASSLLQAATSALATTDPGPRGPQGVQQVRLDPDEGEPEA